MSIYCIQQLYTAVYIRIPAMRLATVACCTSTSTLSCTAIIEISSYLDDFDRDYYYGYYNQNWPSGEPRFSYDDFDDSNANTQDESWTNHVYNLSTGERIIVTANMCDQTLTTPRTNRVQNNDILEIRSRE